MAILWLSRICTHVHLLIHEGKYAHMLSFQTIKDLAGDIAQTVRSFALQIKGYMFNAQNSDFKENALGMLVNTCNPSTEEAEIQGTLRLTGKPF